MSAADDDTNATTETDVVATGAAADSTVLDDELKALPRLLRCAILSDRDDEFIRERLVADIAELAPGLTSATAWTAERRPDLGIVLAAELDRLAVIMDKPDLRGVSDCIRFLCLPFPIADQHRDDHRRLTKSFLTALRRLPATTNVELASEIETVAFGWAALPAADDALSRLANRSAGDTAFRLGRQMVSWRVRAAEAALLTEFAEKRRAREKAEGIHIDANGEETAIGQGKIPADHIVVCRMPDTAVKSPKIKDLIRPFRHVINVALPLAPVPPLHEMRSKLLFEFPYAEAVVDFALADLVGRSTFRLRPLLLVGDAGGGKSRFVRRLSEIMNVAMWRTDASRSDSAIFGGTDRRWSSAEPCHPFLAIAQAKIGNPLVLVDELEKAGTRSDYGRFWDALLGFLEPETATRYPDPALQTELDLSHVSFVATANAVDPLPSPLRDRFRVVSFPKPGIEHLDALIAPVIADLAAERGLDQRWIEPLTGFERDIVAAHWKGGSVRQLRRIVDVVLRTREKAAVRH